MAKKIKFESFKYRFLVAANKLNGVHHIENHSWKSFIENLSFEYIKGKIKVSWNIPEYDFIEAPLSEPKFYSRADTPASVRALENSGFISHEDRLKNSNGEYFEKMVLKIATMAGFSQELDVQGTNKNRIKTEREFHDDWAKNENLNKIDVIKSNEVCTAPEMRFISERIGDVNGKKVLDVGCGLGEASVFFATKGAIVTSSDLSQGMLDATAMLAERYNVGIKKHLCSAEDMQLSEDDVFDVIYAGNLLHHVDIEATITKLRPHLAKDGMLVTWDPLAYNPIINIYRLMARDVRTPDEHPLKKKDINLFSKHFGSVETQYFWFFTLIIFVLMFIGQRRNPNKERFWKVVVQEGDSWAWLYQPLEKLDKFVLKYFPPLRLLCWNVVIISKQKG